MITSGKAASGYDNSNSYGDAKSTETASFQNVRVLINRRNIAAAENMLKSLPQNAEWNFLMGVCCIQKGWYNDGINYIRTANRMDPSNFEYRAALNNFESRNTTYRQYNGGMGRGMNTCDCCANLCIADACCECMGGDLISCC